MEENKYRDAAYGSGMNPRMMDCVEAIVGDADAHLMAFTELRGTIAAVQVWLLINNL